LDTELEDGLSKESIHMWTGSDGC